MSIPLISIIIPTYNRAHLIGETLDSIIAQSYKNWECIIIDDGSIDDTEEVIAGYVKKDKRFQFYKRPVNRTKGANACRNYGFELSKGEWINWFDSDDIYLPNALGKISNKFGENEDVIVTKLEIIDFLIGKKIKENTIFSKNIIEDYFVGKISFYISGPFWKRSFLEKQSNLFDESIGNFDDWDFNLRMLYNKPLIRYIEEPLIQYRYHENSLSKELEKLNFNEIKSEFRARNKHLLLLTKNKITDVKPLKKYIKNRYKYFFRETLMCNHSQKKYFLKKLIYIQLELLDGLGLLKTITGFLIFSIFKKGYILLK